ncbi:Serine/threonine-protein kinase PrkC [Phycisphaerae bacterium RAS1]|nr:Serine/threonine-protein kinase PrkC [Phycisphaerae bacterium RAS1]
MAAKPQTTCTNADTTTTLAAGALHGEEKHRAQEHLEICLSCRLAFRRGAAGRFPPFPNYTILERIGEGGFGVVYKAINHVTQRTEALKLLNSRTPLRSAYFANEVRLIARLRHPNIATLYEAHLSSPPLFYTMEYVEGQRLDEHVRSHNLSLADRIGLVRQVVAAIGHAHAQGVIHRDLKPQNVMIDRGGQARVVDFGIARRLGLARDEQTPPGHEGALGTYGYIAPEQMLGQPPDERADIYALGAMLCAVVTGQPARVATRLPQVFELLRQRDVVRPGDLAAIIAGCVDRLPERRYASCEELLRDLDNYLAGRPLTHSEPAAKLTRVAAFVLMRSPLAVQAVIVAVCAALLTVFLNAGRPRTLAAGDGMDVGVTLVGLSQKTIAAMRERRIGGDIAGLDARDQKSWRLLHGRLMSRLARAAPAVVAWDYYFPDCQPEFDTGLIAGVRELTCPVIVGSADFDAGGEPRLCRTIREAVHAWGSLASVSPGARSQEFVLPYCIQRGFEPLIPGLAVAAFAAARHPECDAAYRVEQRLCEIRYRRRSVAEGQARWLPEPDYLPIVDVGQVRAAGIFQKRDIVMNGRVPIPAPGERQIPQVAYEDILNADDAQLRAWFAGQAVVVGQMIPGRDQHTLKDGRQIFGCEVHAQALRKLLEGVVIQPITTPMLFLRLATWSFLAALLAAALPQARKLRKRHLAAIAAGSTVFGLLLATYGATGPSAAAERETNLAVGVLLLVGGLCYAAWGVRRRQLQLSPGAVWLPADQSSASTVTAGSSMFTE